MTTRDEHDYPMGTEIAFSDSEATVSDGKEGVSTGTINGEPLRDPGGSITHIRVWSERDNGREATTIIVGVGNVLGPAK